MDGPLALDVTIYDADFAVQILFCRSDAVAGAEYQRKRQAAGICSEDHSRQVSALCRVHETFLATSLSVCRWSKFVLVIFQLSLRSFVLSHAWDLMASY